MGKQKNLALWGIQSLISRRCGITRSTVCSIFTGKRRATPKQAAAMEAFFISKGIPLNRWDLLYGVDVENDQSLANYLANKGADE